jgi:hypothetical protein
MDFGVGDVNRRYRNFAPFVRQTGEGKTQTCAKGILRQQPDCFRFAGIQELPRGGSNRDAECGYSKDTLFVRQVFRVRHARARAVIR